MKVYKNKLFKSSVFFSWVLSYMVLIIVTLIITSSVYFTSVNSIERSINKSNKNLLYQMQQKVDILLDSVENLAYQIVWNSNINTILYSDSSNDPYIKYVNTKVVKDFGIYKSTNSWLKSLYVYMKQTEMVYTPDSVYSSDLFYTLKEFPVTKSIDEWLEVMNTKHIKKFLPVTGANSQKNTIAYIQSLPIAGAQLGTTVILINDNYLHELVKEIEWSKDSIFYIIDENNYIIAGETDLEYKNLLGYEDLNNSDSFQIKENNGRKLMISNVSSSIYPIKLALVTPVESYMGELIKIRWITFAAAALCLIIGGIAAYIFSKRNYIHVSELINILKDSSNDNETQGKNEYQYIKSAVKNTLEEKKHISIKLEQHTDHFRNDLLDKLLKGKISCSSSIGEELAYYNISFDTDIFLVILFRIEASSAFFNNLKDEEYAVHMMLAQFIIRNVVEEITSTVQKGVMVELDDMMACIINFNNISTGININDAYFISKESSEFIKSKFDIDITISISNVNKGFIGIRKAYQEALSAMEYKVLYGKGSIIRYNEITASDNRYYYPPEVERHLINYIKAGDLDKSLQLFNEVFKRNISGSSVSIQIAKCLMFNLISTMMKALMEIDTDEEFLSGNDPIRQLLECQTVYEMKDKMNNLLSDICKYIESKKQSHNIELKEEIEKYILNNYHDTSMNIEKISDVLNMNASYLSRFFKEQTGQSIANFINNVRIKNAKKLLKESQYNLDKIGSMTGFTNSVTFIRVFKKYEGITPGKYREIYIQ